jgi:hypothetical protein
MIPVRRISNLKSQQEEGSKTDFNRRKVQIPNSNQRKGQGQKTRKAPMGCQLQAGMHLAVPKNNFTGMPITGNNFT